MKRIVISWPGFTGYMGPCFKALSAQCELKVYIEPSRYEQRFDARSMDGVPFERVSEDELAATVEAVRDFAPDVVLICGWSTPLSMALARAKVGGRKVLAFDMPWEWSLRKLVAPVALWPRLRHFDAAFVPGERCARYARWLGFRGRRLVLGSNPSGWERFASGETNAATGFLFAGRFVREKGLDILLAAYAQYRAAVPEPWPLDLVGSGDALPSDLPEGVRLLGFVPPERMPQTMREHACLVLPSRWEPWGVCAAEAMCAGRMTVLSAACGLADDIAPTARVRTGDVRSLAQALERIHRLDGAARAAEAARVRAAAQRYSAAEWAQRVLVSF